MPSTLHIPHLCTPWNIPGRPLARFETGSSNCHIVPGVKFPWRAMLSLVIVVIMLPESQVTTNRPPIPPTEEASRHACAFRRRASSPPEFSGAVASDVLLAPCVAVVALPDGGLHGSQAGSVPHDHSGGQEVDGF